MKRDSTPTERRAPARLSTQQHPPAESVPGAPRGLLLALGLVWLGLVLGGCHYSPKEITPLAGRSPNAGSLAMHRGGPMASARPQIPGALPSPAEELWIIARGDEPKTAAGIVGEDIPGSGTLMTRREGRDVPVPLKHTDVKASVSGYIASVEVTQQFHNPYDGKIEAVYVFPLPHNAAVNEFIMTLGERRIRGIIRERQEAEKIYHEARSQGHVASLLTQERPNIFTQKVANLEPGKQIDVNIRYFHTLAYDDGWYEFVFPMVVGPRFNPPAADGGTGVPPVRTDWQLTGGTPVPLQTHHLKPGERSGHDIALRVEVDAGVEIEEFKCRTHVVTREPADGRLVVALNPNDAIPNKDFVLRYRVAGGRIKPGLLTHRDERGGFASLMLFPPKELTALGRQPLELVFVLDCSGSMNGRPIAQAKAAIERALRRLEPDDSFQLISFSERAAQLGPRPLEATPANIERGLRHLAGLNSEGGTMMIEGIKAALDFPHDPRRLRFVCFLTDGYIGNEAEILAAIDRRLGAARIFSFGIGSSVNRYLLEHMAKTGRGAVAYLGLHDSAADIMDGFFNRIAHPALTDVEIDWGAARAAEVFPARVPDLFVGRPVVVTGRFTGAAPASVRVRGRAGGRPVEFTVKTTPAPPPAARALPAVWARMKIAELGDRAVLDRHGELNDEIKRVALEYGLMSAHTAFIAVDASRRTEGDVGTTVPVPVPVPDGVKYKTTVPREGPGRQQ